MTDAINVPRELLEFICSDNNNSLSRLAELRAIVYAPSQPAQVHGCLDGDQLIELLERARLEDEDARPHGNGATYWNNAVFMCQTVIRDALAAAPKPPVQPPVQEPVCYITGYYGGRCTVAPINNAAVLPCGMALYAAPQPPVQARGWQMPERRIKRPNRLYDDYRDGWNDCLDEVACLNAAAIDAAMAGGGVGNE